MRKPPRASETVAVSQRPTRTPTRPAAWPARRLLQITGLWVAIATVLLVTGQAGTLGGWVVLGILLATLALLDLAVLWRERPAFSLNRSVPGRWPVQRPVDIQLSLGHRLARRLKLRLHEIIPDGIDSDHLPLVFALPGQQKIQLRWEARAHQRGRFHMNACHVAWQSRLGFWWRRTTLEQATPFKVYPDFNLIVRYGRLAGDRRLNEIGIHSQQRRGSGTDFDQLRDYRDGDSLRQIDWHATARMQRLITKSYQEERSQRVVFLQDCSRRLRAMDGQHSHFDQSLNALLLLAHVALRQGDEIALETVGQAAEQPSALGSGRGQRQFAHLLETVFDLAPANTTPDFAEAAGRLMSRHRRRSLVVILTNLRDEDHQELDPALKMLRQRHLVVLADLREVVDLESTARHGHEQFDQALLEAALRLYRQQRRAATRQLRQLGVVHLDLEPAALPAALVSQYRQLKASGAF